MLVQKTLGILNISEFFLWNPCKVLMEPMGSVECTLDNTVLQTQHFVNLFQQKQRRELVLGIYVDWILGDMIIL